MTRREIVFPPRPGDATADLQAAMDTAATSGTPLTLAAGTHRCGGLRLPSGLDLRLAAGATLKLDPDYECYAGNRAGVVAEKSDRAMLHAVDAAGLRISGPGTIEAPGPAYAEGRNDAMGVLIPAWYRPRLLVLERCTDAAIEDLALLHSPMWTVHLVACRGVRLAGLAITNDREMPNTDGIVIDSCEDVAVSDCTIVTADDGVVLKTSAGADDLPLGPCRRITVSGCRVESWSCGLKIGTESFADVEDVAFTDCTVSRSNRAVGIFSRDGGAIRRIAVRGLVVDCRETPDGYWGSGEAITVNGITRRAARPAGVVEDLVFSDVRGRMEGAVNLFADRPGGLARVALSRIRLEQRPGEHATGAFDLRPTGADLAAQAEHAGWGNAWVRGPDGRIAGLVAYAGGMPGLAAVGVDDLVLDDVAFDRPVPLPPGWNREPVTIEAAPGAGPPAQSARTSAS